jgi:hypothetical protein
MTKEQCTAIIHAIEASTNFLFQYGVNIRDRIADPTNDRAAVAADALVYSGWIQTIVDSIPDDPEE